MDKNFKYTLEQNKQKIILGTSIVGVIAVGFGVFSMINKNNNKEVPKDEIYVDTENVKVEYIISGNEKGELDLIDVSNNKLAQSLKLDTTEPTIYSRSNDLESVLAHSNGVFYSIKEEQGKLIKEEILKLEAKQSIKDFKFSDEYIVANTGDKLLVFKLEDKSTHMIDAKDVDSMLVLGKTLVYSETENIHTYNLETKEDKSINIGDKTEELLEIDGKVIAFNKFGSGNSKSTILKLKSEDLYIEKAHRHDNAMLIPVTTDSEDTIISFIDANEKAVNKNSFYTLDLNSEKDNKKRIKLSNSDTEYTTDNTVVAQGYLYSMKDNKIEIFRIAGEVVDSTINNDKSFFMPVSKEVNPISDSVK